MADIFVSYAKEDLPRARDLAEALQLFGWSVWWDRRLRPGEDFAKVIAAAVRDARCLIVLWSKASVGSGWVRDEANEGLKRQVLVPLLIDAVEPPLGFRSIQTGDLIGWDGDRSAPGFQQLVADLVPLLGEPPKARVAPQSRPMRTTPSSSGPRRDSELSPGGGVSGARRWIVVGGIGVIVVGVSVWGGFAYKAEMDRKRHAEEAARKADEERKRLAAEEERKRAEAAARRKEEEDRRRALMSTLPRTSFRLPGDGTRNNNASIGPFCCTGETLIIRTADGREVGYVYVFNWRGQARMVGVRSVVPDAEILISGSTDISSATAGQQRSAIFFSAAEMIVGSRKTAVAGRLRFTATIDSVQLTTLSGAPHYYMDSLYVRMDVEK